ncbi:helix-turn-helix domain-containing protein [Limosilactobacillus urinaemulieris]|uniref:winged helix-turn-helix transcriptional regulator n=1 Tax=Limosilactobacillus urinaemulieris TaxID=2742600 RepID=UPI001F5A7A05|nr:winged helix-turn-helix transcriptional regulator [Limosilactobacillus urinaemulieris]
MAEKEVLSEIQITLNVIGGKWKPLILHYLEKNGTKRYSEILHYLELAPKKTLTTQLRELEHDGIIKRTVIPTVPVQVEYSITNHGRSLFPLLDVMCAWGYLNSQDYQVKHTTCTYNKETTKIKQARLHKLYEMFAEDHLGDWQADDEDTSM